VLHTNPDLVKNRRTCWSFRPSCSCSRATTCIRFSRPHAVHAASVRSQPVRVSTWARGARPRYLPALMAKEDHVSQPTSGDVPIGSDVLNQERRPRGGGSARQLVHLIIARSLGPFGGRFLPPDHCAIVPRDSRGRKIGSGRSSLVVSLMRRPSPAMVASTMPLGLPHAIIRRP